MNAAERIDATLASGPEPGRLSPVSGLKTGAAISHSIRLVRPLGSGGMGQVWLAEHTSLDTHVAVKFMWKEMAQDPVNVARFEREAKLAARIKSPHVVSILDYSATADGVPFIVMELLNGRDLETWLGSGRRLDLEDTSRVLIQVCKALAKAHALGVVHRDIKAENVFLVDGDGEILIKVLDFGVAKDEDQVPITVSGTTVGTPSYMSPEQLFHPKEVDFRTDLWSAAVLVYRCLTGKFPFGGDAFPSVCLAVAKGNFSAPSALNKDLPAGLDAWFKKAFHRNPKSRFLSAAEMADAFLVQLDKAGHFPTWARTSKSEGGFATCFTDSERFGGRPSTRRRNRRPSKWGVMALVAGAAVFSGLVMLTEQAAIVDTAAEMLVRSSAAAIAQGGLMLQLNPTEEAPPKERSLEWLAPPTLPALAERDVLHVPHDGGLAQARPESKKASLPAAPNAATADGSVSAAGELPQESSWNLATIRFGL